LNQRSPIVLPAMREDRGRFAALRDSRVLIYWPHGLGDWVHFGAIAPLLEPSNAYAMTRFGDDYVSIMEGKAPVMPLFSGVTAPATSAPPSAPHMGLELQRCNGRPVTLDIQPPLYDAVAQFNPSLLLWTDYPETEGRTAYPFHTKARNLVRLLVSRQRLGTLDLANPLRNAIDFTVPATTQRHLDEALAAFAPAGTRLAAISRAGVTAARKNWGAGDAQSFVEAMRLDDPRWRFISMEDEPLGEGVAGFRALFASLGEPFARVYKALCNRLELFVGIPAGPLHVIMARGGVATVGLWLSHHPDWYDEPNPAAIQLVGRYVRDRRFERRIATTSKPPALGHRLGYLDSLSIEGDAVADAARTLLK
jgi:hypothetical protein